MKVGALCMRRRCTRGANHCSQSASGRRSGSVCAGGKGYCYWTDCIRCAFTRDTCGRRRYVGNAERLADHADHADYAAARLHGTVGCRCRVHSLRSTIACTVCGQGQR